MLENRILLGVLFLAVGIVIGSVRAFAVYLLRRHEDAGLIVALCGAFGAGWLAIGIAERFGLSDVAGALGIITAYVGYFGGRALVMRMLRWQEPN
ncbi:MAG TPA: hypothetical protein VJ553_00345 [Candidatus Paceibacterota bacterium]|nr:hypothetical protein [Candidatus Paceibacterota bacterium]